MEDETKTQILLLILVLSVVFVFTIHAEAPIQKCLTPPLGETISEKCK